MTTKRRPFHSVGGVQAVTRGAGTILHDGQPATDHAVEQRRLAHVGAAHDGDEGQAVDGQLAWFAAV